MRRIKVTVWNEYAMENPLSDLAYLPQVAEAAKVYPEGIHNAIAKYLQSQFDFEVRTATFDQPEHGLPEEVLNATDVLVWWDHVKHDKLSDTVVDRIYKRVVLDGMGLILLHSSISSKIAKRLLGFTCKMVRWRLFKEGEKERLWVMAPTHPIVEGIGEYFELEQTEMYGEYCNIPTPDELIFVSWFKGGEIFRSGLCYNRGMGKIFYFRPGHETFPVYYNSNVQKVISNAIRWATPVKRPFDFRKEVKFLKFEKEGVGKFQAHIDYGL